MLVMEEKQIQFGHQYLLVFLLLESCDEHAQDVQVYKEMINLIEVQIMLIK